MSLSNNIANWIKQRVKDSKANGIVVGLSGGIDSACVAALAKMAIGDNVLGLILSCQSDSQDERFAQLVVDKFKIKKEKVCLDPVYNKFIGILPDSDKLSFANLKPRLRMVALYYFANKLNYLVAGTGNKSEALVGYFTKYGDGGVDILPLGGLLKTEVRALAKELEVPKEVIERIPTAGLWQGQTDESELGIKYEDLDQIIIAIESGKEKIRFSQTIVNKVKKLIKDSEHKRLPVPIYRKK
ncbi:NAD(+) synthase [Candidatus Omnitrophota bacterium]